MRRYILIILFMPFMVIGQNTSAKASFKVDGVCGMCKLRIETSTIKLKGVKSSKWNVNTGQISLIFNEKKIKLKDIHQFIADLGHDTDKIKAPDLAYNSLDACCKYRDPAVVMDHQ
jgi:copper chaperone CopZ